MQALGLEAPPVRLSCRSSSAGCDRIAGVHSTVWIFAISAALTMRAQSNRRSPSQSGLKRLSSSQIALCSRANSVQQAEAGPPVARRNRSARSPVCRPGHWGRGIRSVMIEVELAVGHELGRLSTELPFSLRRRARKPLRRLAVAAVDSRGIPPVRFGIGVGRRIFQAPAIPPSFAFVIAGRVRPRAPDSSAAALAPRIVVGERHLELAAGAPARRIEPVMRLELDPGGGETVQRGRRDEMATRQQFGADQADWASAAPVRARGRPGRSEMLRPKRAPGLLRVKYMLLASVSSGRSSCPSRVAKVVVVAAEIRAARGRADRTAAAPTVPAGFWLTGNGGRCCAGCAGATPRATTPEIEHRAPGRKPRATARTSSSAWKNRV